MFELKERDGLSRICQLTTAHGKVETPTLLPVINPNQLLIKPKEMVLAFGIKALITNSYIIRKHEDLREPALRDGLHNLIDFDGMIMTDSGTFQSHIYGDIDVNHLDIVEFQEKIGSDIGTILDVFGEPDHTHSRAKADLEETIRRGKESTPLKGKMLLAGPIQGGVYADLRKKSAKEMSALDFDFHPIGGVVPLMEKQRYDLLVDAIINSKMGLTPDRPVHLFGCGHPMVFPLAALLGCDFFDSSAYAKFAKDGRMMFSDGTRFLRELKELPCECPVCTSHSPETLMASPEKEKLIAMHNLHVSFGEIRRVKQAIREGRIWELAEQRCRNHPTLLEGFRQIAKYRDWLERFEPLSRELAFMHVGADSHHRPTISRYRKNLGSRYEPAVCPRNIIFKEGRKPYYRYYAGRIVELGGANFWVNSYFGPAPIELDEIYPLSQSVTPETLESSTLSDIGQYLEAYMKTVKGEVIDNSPECPMTEGTFDIDARRIRAVADFQFGKGAADALLSGEIELVKSKKTGRIRNVIVEGQHVLSMRATDGFYTLKPEGAKLLHAAFPAPKLRVKVLTETTEFNREGKNVMAKFVLDCDENLAIGDECLVVDEDDKLAAIGRVQMIKEEMLAFNTGIAVKTRDGIKN